MVVLQAYSYSKYLGIFNKIIRLAYVLHKPHFEWENAERGGISRTSAHLFCLDLFLFFCFIKDSGLKKVNISEIGSMVMPEILTLLLYPLEGAGSREFPPLFRLKYSKMAIINGKNGFRGFFSTVLSN